MTVCSKYLTCLTLAAIAFAISPAYSASGLVASDIEKYRVDCWSNPDYNLSLKFSPVSRLPKESRVSGQWSYAFKTEDQLYPDNQLSLPKSAAARVDLVMQLNQSGSDIGESYLWTVIAAPRVKGWRYGGHWPTKKPITEYQRLKDKRESLVNIATLSEQGGQPVHSKISPKDIDSAGSLNNAWEDIFGKKIVSQLVYPASKNGQSNRGGYSLTFYYVPTPALGLINQDGYKWPSFKHVDNEGKVFGFVLTPDGECLSSSSVDVVRE